SHRGGARSAVGPARARQTVVRNVRRVPARSEPAEGSGRPVRAGAAQNAETRGVAARHRAGEWPPVIDGAAVTVRSEQSTEHSVRSERRTEHEDTRAISVSSDPPARSAPFSNIRANGRFATRRIARWP